MSKTKITFQFVVVLLFMSCDFHTKIAIVKNRSSDTVGVVIWDDKELGIITDSMIYNNRLYMSGVIQPNSFTAIGMPGRNFDKDPDSLKIQLYVLNLDSMSTYQRLKLDSHISRYCLIRKVTIKANEIGRALDTIYVK